MSPLLRFTGATHRDPALRAWLDAIPNELAPLARHWFGVLRACGPDVRELLHDGVATVCVHDVPFAYVGAYRAHVSVGFFHGARLADPRRMLEGKGVSGRHVKLRPGGQADEEALAELVAASHAYVLAAIARE